MLRLSRLVLLLLVTLVLAAFVPGLYRKGFERRRDRLFILYSAPAGRFFYRKTDRFNRVTYHDEAGNTYERTAYEKQLPFFYYRDLAKWGELPEVVCDLPVTVEEIRYETQVLRINPDDLHTPQIQLWPLFESESPFARLEYPDRMFRITERMEFLDAAANEVLEEPSRAFTDALRGKGFLFPARLIAGNPTDRKPFDEGYFVVDAAGRLFHLKMVKGRPWVEDTGIAPPSGIRFIQVREHPRREFYGWMLTGDGKVHLITYRNYALKTLPIDGYDPDRMRLQMLTDPLHRTLTYYDPDEDVIHARVTDLTYRKVHGADFTVGSGGGGLADTAAEVLFPFRIETSSRKTDYVLLDLRPGGLPALGGVALSLAALWWIRRRRRTPPSSGIADWIVTALAGPFGLAAVLAVGPEPRRDGKAAERTGAPPAAS